LSRLEPRALGGISSLGVLGLVEGVLSLDATELVVGYGPAVESDRDVDQSELMPKGISVCNQNAVSIWKADSEILLSTILSCCLWGVVVEDVFDETFV
jgi:hypothetical protein